MYGIYANIGGILMVNVTIYSSTMDPMGMAMVTVQTFPNYGGDNIQQLPPSILRGMRRLAGAAAAAETKQKAAEVL